MTSQVTFSCFHSSFLSDVYCSHSEVKPVANIKSVAAALNEVIHSAVDSAGGCGSGGQLFESQRGKVFSTRKEKLIYATAPELNSLACRSRAILPTFCRFMIDDETFTGPYFSLYCAFLVVSQRQPLNGYYFGALSNSRTVIAGAIIGLLLVTPKQVMEPKSEWFCGVMYFRSNFKVG